jgi:GAF domain-containing protein/CheY-like chemotaxis protein
MMQTRQKGRTLYSRIMRRVLVVVTAAALLLGVALFINGWIGQRIELVDSQGDALDQFAEDTADRLSIYAADARRMAESRPARDFARDTLINVNTTSIIDSQTRLLSDFTSLLEARVNEYLAIRYVTSTGSIWSAVTNYSGTRPTANAQVGLNYFRDDPTLLSALALVPGQVAVQPLEFYNTPQTRAANEVIPFIRMASPVTVEGDTVGLVQLDIRADRLLSDLLLSFSSVAAETANRRIFLIDANGSVIIDSNIPLNEYLTTLANRSGTPLSALFPSLTNLISDGQEALAVDVGDVIYSTQAAGLGSPVDLGWRLVLVDDELAVIQELIATAAAPLIATLVGAAVFYLLFGAFLRRVLRPIDDVSSAAQPWLTLQQPSVKTATLERPALSTSDLFAETQRFRVEAPSAASSAVSKRAEAPGAADSASVDELGDLLRAFHSVDAYVRQMEALSREQVERYARNLDIAARISRQTATLHDIDQLLNRAINLICTEYGFYHAQVFLVDDAGLNAVLVYSYGEAGQKLLEQGHRLPIGSASVIGRVTATGRYALVHDTQRMEAGETHRVNPLLPNTRTELALPLNVSDRVIGALDIQHTIPNSFREDELNTFQLLADQIALAVANARLIQQVAERSAAQTSAQLPTTSWLEANRISDRGYRYDLLTLEAGEVQPKTPQDELVRLPIAIRGEVVGSLDAAPPEMGFTEGDWSILRAVADRVSLVIENTRLFEETQEALQETSSLYQLSRLLNEANTQDEILRALLESVLPNATSTQIAVFDDYTPGTLPVWMRITADVSAQETARQEVVLTGIELQVADHPLIREMQPNQIALVEDVERDNRLDEVLRAMLHSLGTRSMIIIPFAVRAVWRGVILAHFSERQAFSERDGRIFSALIDQAGVAIDNRMLLRENELALEQIERLYTASRITNMAETPVDLILAAIATTTAPEFHFELGLFEGALDDTGWPTRIRVLAGSEGDRALADNRLYDLPIAPESPLRYREPQIVIDRDPDQPSDQALLTFLRERRRRFVAVFPLYSANQPLALLFVSAADVRDLTSEDYKVYRALTGQMSTVLQNRRLLDQTALALDETRRLYAASRAIAAALDTQTIYDTAARYLALALPSLSSVTTLLAGPKPTIEAAYTDVVYRWRRDSENPPTPNDLAVGDRLPSILVPFPALMSAQDGQYAVLNQVSSLSSGTWSDLALMLNNHNSQSAALAELRARQQWYGVLLCESGEENAFTEAFIRFFTAISDQVAIAVDSLMLFREAQDQAQRALALAEAAQLASQIGREFERSIAEVFQRMAQPANYDRWSLLLANDDRSALNVVLLGAASAPARFKEEIPNEQRSIFLAARGLATVDAFVENQMMLVNDPNIYEELPFLPPGFIEVVGKHMAMPVVIDQQPVGVIVVGRPLNAPDLDNRDEQLVRTLAAQVSIALENQRLFQAAQSERATLRSILETLPAGVVVLEPNSLTPILSNDQASYLLGQSVASDRAFNAANYSLLRTGTNSLYDDNNLPISVTRVNRRLAASDDITVIHNNGAVVNLLINAAPIIDSDGQVSAIVTAFQDITTLRALEDTLQNNLQETIALYETTRALAEADEIDNVLDEALARLMVQQPSDAYVLLLDDDELHGTRVVRSMYPEREFSLPGEILDAQRVILVDNTTAPLDELRRERFPVDRQTADALLLAGVRAIASVPLRSRSRRDVPIGWMVMIFDEPQQFGIEREQFLTTLGDAVAVALDNRYLFQSTQVALRQTAALYGATTAISRSRDYEGISGALQNALASLSPDMYAAYLLVDNRLTELFSINLDGASVDFRPIITDHDLLHGATNVYHDDVRANISPTAFEEEVTALGNVRGIGVVLLRSTEGASGCLVIAYHDSHRFSDGEARYLSALSDSASVVINNVLLFAQIEEALSETRILYQASRALSDSTTSEDILRAVVDHLSDRSVSQVFLIKLTSDDWYDSGTMAQVAAFWQPEGMTGIDLTGIALNAEQYPAWRLLASSSVLMIDDVQIEESLDPMERVGVESLDMRAMAVLPLRVSGRDLGAIIIGANAPYKHSYRDARIYRSLAEQASLRMEASRLLEQTERRARQLVTSAQVSQIASSILDLNYLFPRIVDLVRDSFRYDHVQIFMMDDNDEFAELRASTGEPGRQLLAIRHKLAKGSLSVIGQVTARAEPFIATDTTDARVIHKPNPYLPNTRSEMAIPLLLKGKVVGALDVQSNQPNAFAEDDVVVLTTLSNQIAVAIDNARLYEASQQRASEMSFLFSTTTAAAAASSLNEALRNIADELRSSLEALSVTIYLPEQYIDSQNEPFTLLRAAALSGVDQPMSEISEIRLDTSTNLIAAAANDRYPLLIGDITQYPNYLPVVDGARSAAIVPLTVGGQLVGVIMMESPEANSYDDDTLTLLLTLAGSLSAVIQNQQLLEQVQRTNEQLLELDKLKSQFLANMSHELRTPLNSIIGFSRVILKGIDGPLTEMQEQDLTTIYNSGQHLLNLINDILDQAKIAAGKMDLQSDYFDMKGVIDAVRSIGIGLVKDKPIDIFVEVAPALPQAFGDEFRTRQVLLNLISNAAKFTREGSITIVAYIEPDENGVEMVRVDVSDTGIGIAEADMSALFEAFRQVDSSLTRTQGGTGLGLPIAKSLIEMQGGSMLVASKVNVGSTFSILVPTKPGIEEDRKPDTGGLNGATQETGATSEIESTPPPSPARDTLETGPLRFVRPIKRQLLLIEDDPDMVDQFRRTLQRQGFEIYTASIPLEAKPMASGLHPNIILMDVNFSQGAGWEILEWLKSRDDTRDIPVVIVSLSDEGDKALEIGAFRYIRRPFTPEQLIDVVKEAEEESRISRILIIDDHQDSVRMLQETLVESGSYRVFSANSGMEGIAQVARRRPDLVILDLRMPEMDGFRVIQELRSNPETATIPILVVTADTLEAHERDQLSSLEVIYKQEINAQSRRFIDNVRTRLNKNGEPM